MIKLCGKIKCGLRQKRNLRDLVFSQPAHMMLVLIEETLGSNLQTFQSLRCSNTEFKT